MSDPRDIKVLKTIRFDQSDDHVFDHPSGVEQIAVPGGFAFAHLAESDVTGKTKQAFANGFLDVENFGRSTFVTVGLVNSDERDLALRSLAQHFVDVYGAPDLDSALEAATAEFAFVEELTSDALINTVFTVRRWFDEAGEIREEFRTIKPPTDKPLHARIWSVEDDEELEVSDGR